MDTGMDGISEGTCNNNKSSDVRIDGTYYEK